MNDAHALLLVLGILYLSDCFLWVRPFTVAFFSRGRRRFLVKYPNPMLGNFEGGLLFLHPLPPLGTVFLSHLLPVSISPSSVCAYISQTFAAAARPRQRGTVLGTKDLESVRASGLDVVAGGKPFIKCRTVEQAGSLAGLLTELGSAPEADRAGMIQDALRNAFRLEEIKNRIEECKAQTRTLLLLSNFLFVYLFLVSPILVWRFGLVRLIVFLAAGLLVLTASIAVEFYRVHKSLCPMEKEERISSVVKMALCPPTAIRARDVITANLLAPYHPIAAAYGVLEDKEFQSFARRFLLDMEHPIASEIVDETIRSAEQWSRTTMVALCREFLTRNNLNAEEFFLPPAPSDAACIAYCPRCCSQFTIDVGECPDCSGIHLVRFPSFPEPARPGNAEV